MADIDFDHQVRRRIDGQNDFTLGSNRLGMLQVGALIWLETPAPSPPRSTLSLPGLREAGCQLGLLSVPLNGTVVPDMSTESHGMPISVALFSKNRRAVLALLFGHPDQDFYLRQIVRACGGGVGAIQRELKQLGDAGIIQRTARHNQVFFQANTACPVFEELKSLVVKTAGVVDVLRAALAPLADRIMVAFIFGSVARAEQNRESDVDFVVVGQLAFSEVVESLADAQQHLAREVNPVVYSHEEFRAKVATGHHFLASVLRKPKVFLIGDDDELTRLASKHVAHGT